MVAPTSDDIAFNAHATASRGVVGVVLTYVLVAGLWVVLSDWLMALVTGSPYHFALWNIAKGLLFIGVTATLLYAMLIRLLERQATRDKTFHSLIEHAKDSILLCDAGLSIVYANPATQKITGYSADELLGRPVNAILSDKYSALLGAHIAALARHPFIRQEWEIRHKEGWHMHIEVTTQRLPDGSYLAMGSDLTETRRAQKKADEERQRLRALIRSMPDPVWLMDTEGVVITCNPAFEKLLDLPAAADLPRPPSEFASFIKTQLQAGANAAQITLNHTHCHPDGTLSHFEITKSPVFDTLGELIGVVGIARDVTAAYQNREELAASERRFRTLFDSATEMIFVTDLEANFLNANKCACDKLGYTRDEQLTMRVMDVHTDTTFDDYQRLWNSDAFRAGQGVIRRGTDRRKDGTSFPVEILVNRFELDNQLLSMTIVRDITEQKRSEDLVRASEEFNRAVLDASATQMAVVDKSGKIVAVNDAWIRFTRENSDAPIDELKTGVGSNFFEVCRHCAHPDSEQAQAALAGVQAVLNGESVRFSIESACITPKRELWFMMNAAPLKLGAGGAVITYVDISSVKQAQKLQERLTRQLQAMARMHQDIQEKERHHLSMELHDQIGQALAALKISLASAWLHVDEKQAIQKRLTYAQEVIDGIAQTTRDIARRLRPPLLDQQGLRSALAWHIRNLTLPPNVYVRFEQEIDALRFSEAVELACFRIAQEGITNALRHAEAAEVVVRISCTPDHIHLSVQDDGKGFDVDIRLDESDEQISLGLIGIRERIASLDGHFEIDSQPNNGTRVSACLPRIARA
ncbi:MAG: PAS domain S-box protein [Azonexus sp.]